jgi:hypothetical protein
MKVQSRLQILPWARAVKTVVVSITRRSLVRSQSSQLEIKKGSIESFLILKKEKRERIKNSDRQEIYQVLDKCKDMMAHIRQLADTGSIPVFAT